MTYAEALAFEVECVTTSINRSLDALAGIVGGKHLASGVHEVPRSAFDAIPGKAMTLHVESLSDAYPARVVWSKRIGSVDFYTDEPADMPATLTDLPPSHPLLAADPGSDTPTWELEQEMDDRIADQEKSARDVEETMRSLPWTNFSSIA